EQRPANELHHQRRSGCRGGGGIAPEQLHRGLGRSVIVGRKLLLSHRRAPEDSPWGEITGANETPAAVFQARRPRRLCESPHKRSSAIGRRNARGGIQSGPKTAPPPIDEPPPTGGSSSKTSSSSSSSTLFPASHFCWRSMTSSYSRRATAGCDRPDVRAAGTAPSLRETGTPPRSPRDA